MFDTFKFKGSGGEDGFLLSGGKSNRNPALQAGNYGKMKSLECVIFGNNQTQKLGEKLFYCLFERIGLI